MLAYSGAGARRWAACFRWWWPIPHLRALARTPGRRRLPLPRDGSSRTIGVWQAVAEGAQPILDMVVTDSKLQDAVRPTFLTFTGDVAPGEPFAHMIENGPLLAALYDKAKAEGVTLIPAAVETFGGDTNHVSLPVTLEQDAGVERTLFSLRPMARARGCANVPALHRMAGRTISPLS